MVFRGSRSVLLASAMFASTGLGTVSAAVQEPAPGHLQMIAEIDAMIASTSGSSAVTRLTPPVRSAMAAVPRHEFVPPEYKSAAYRNWALPIGHEQTISQPVVVALM